MAIGREGALEKPLAIDRWLLRLVTRIHCAVYLRSGGALGGRMLWIRFLMLRHVGRKTGREHQTPLLYVEDGDRWVIVASNAGADRNPAWLHNLADRPLARIQVGRETFEVRWRPARGDERERLWEKLTRAYRFYPAYRRRAGREIPLVVLERADSPPSGP
jgi:deazaflavin-dependent oxidoreductase (nitroreductase family)